MEATPNEQLASVDFALVVNEYRLRPWTPADAQVMADIVAEPTIPRWTFLPYEMTAAQAADWIEHRDAQRDSGSGLALAIEARRSGEVLGCVGLAGLQAELGPEAYYWLGSASCVRDGSAAPPSTRRDAEVTCCSTPSCQRT